MVEAVFVVTAIPKGTAKKNSISKAVSQSFPLKLLVTTGRMIHCWEKDGII